MKVQIFTYTRRKAAIVFSCLFLALQAWSFTHAAEVDPVDRIDLEEAFLQISKKYNAFFNYDRSIARDIVVEYTEDRFNSLEDALSSVLHATELGYRIYDDRYVVVFQNNNAGIESLKNMIGHMQGLVEEKEIDQQKRVVPPLISVKNIPSAKQLVRNRFIFDLTGNVTDEDGQPLIGVNIQVKGSSKGTATDLDGNFSLEDIDENAVLVISYVGYQTQEVEVSGRSNLHIVMIMDSLKLEELIVVGYGTQKKSDLTGSVERLDAEKFKTQPVVQVTDMLTGTIAGFNANQSTSAQGGASMEIRGPTSLSASTSPLIVLDGVIYNGTLRDINPYDIESIDVLKDASSAAVFGAKAASGVVIITTNKGVSGKPAINFSVKTGITENYNERRGLGPDEYIQFRQDYFRQLFPNQNYYFYSNPNELPNDVSIEEWRTLSSSEPLDDDLDEWMARLRLFPEEQRNYKAGRTMDMYDQVFRTGIKQDYDLSISGGTDDVKYYWSLGYNDNEGIRVGDQFSTIRSRINAEFKIVEWLKAGVNAQFSDRNDSSVPASLSFYGNSPYGELYDDKGNLKRLPHGHTSTPLLDYKRTSLSNKTNSLFANMFMEVDLLFGIKYRLSFQPHYESYKYLSFTTISEELGGEANEDPSGERRESSTLNWMMDNLITWNKEFGDHQIDVTLLANIEENRNWSTTMSNRKFSPNQELIYHGLHFGNSPVISVNDTRSTGDAYMARINYTLQEKYLFTGSVRRDGFSAFGLENPRAVFPAVALGWIISNEEFFKSDLISRLKLRTSWGVNGNRDIGIYSALARTSSSPWYDGSSTRMGIYNSTLANNLLKWEKTAALNLGLEVALWNNRVDLNADIYHMNTTDLLMNRLLPRITGFQNITTNLGKLQNRGLELSINTINIDKQRFQWNTNLNLSLNRNEIVELFGDYGTYRLLNEEREGDVPDFSNGWFPGEALDVVWDYEIIGIWQSDEKEEAARYGLEPGDFKGVDVNNDGRYVDLDDKQFIGYTNPRYRLGLRNEFQFLNNFSAYVFLRADLGHIGSYNTALNTGHESNDRRSRNNGPVPYWTVDNPNDEYARLNTYTGSYGGGLSIYKPRSFVRVQDISLSYNIPNDLINRYKIERMQIYGSVRNLMTFTKWPGWDPESGMNPMPRTFMIGLNCSL